jgi:hypothetical protein
LLFGNAVERPYVPQPSPHDLFGLAVHHAVRARFCIERGRSWQAEHWIAGIRDNALSLACRRRGLDARHGRSFDDLPADVLDAFGASLVRSMERRISCARSMPRSASCCVTRPRLPTSLRKLNLGSAN